MALQNNKDIVIENGGTKYHFSYLEWDSHFFSRTSYGLNTDLSQFQRDCNPLDLEMGSQFKNSFVTAKVDPSSNPQIIKTLQNAGFYYVETEMKLLYQQGHFFELRSGSEKGIKVYELIENRGLPYKTLGSTFQNTRFHTDPNISMEKADELWNRYLKSYVPDENHFIYVAEVENEIVGVILANKTHREVFLFFVAVDARFQGLGVGSRLMEYVVTQFSGCDIFTGTQAKNIQAINYYIKNGFSKIILTKVVLHFWSTDNLK